MQNQKKQDKSKQQQDNSISNNLQSLDNQIQPASNQQSNGQASEDAQQDEWESFQNQQSSSQNIDNLIQQLQQIQQQMPQSSEMQADASDQLQPQNQPQIANQQQQSLGCSHYRRNCLVEAPCCKIFYTCKLCHDEKYQGVKSAGCKVDRMEFDKVNLLKCLKCGKIQEPSQKCVNPQCEVRFGKYACLKCKLYENKSQKVNDIFHCDECKMCRRGKPQKFFHCKKCGYCRAISQKNNHKCNQNVAESECPVCLEVLKFSTKYYQSLPCGHLIHLECLALYNNINCPVCGMATQKLSESKNKQIDRLIEQTKGNLPKQLIDKKVDVLCNECLHKSCQRPFHFFGIKCEKCGTYNTKMI